MKRRLRGAVRWQSCKLRYRVAELGFKIQVIGRLSDRLFRRDLRHLNDLLARTRLAGRYWVWAGLVLGWAREGRLLARSLPDADFGVRAEDAMLIEEAIPQLERGGYRLLWRFRNNDGQITEYTFLRHGAKFEFFIFFSGTAAGCRRYFTYLVPNRIELESQLPEQTLEPFEFLDRTWLKPRLHELELAAIYGDWRTPDPNWFYADDLTIFARRPWTRPDRT